MNTRKLSKRKILIITIVSLICIFIFLLWQNNSIVITKNSYGNIKIPKEFDNYVIAHISDLHNKEFGTKQTTLLNKLRKTTPDVILITGDLVDSRHFDLDPVMDFVKGAIEIAPIYYVSGNHEALSNQYKTVVSSLTDAGVKVLDNEVADISLGGSKIHLIGVMDPSFGLKDLDMSRVLEEGAVKDALNLLLSHRPELLNLYADYNMDLVFSGHAHGGQFRLPFIGGLIAPNQGFLPKYTSGRYNKGNTSMYVSRGLGNSIIPLRIFNNPEIVIVTLKYQP